MELTKSQQAAAFHGVATNIAYLVEFRLQAALQALEWYEAEVERLQTVVAALTEETNGTSST